MSSSGDWSACSGAKHPAALVNVAAPSFSTAAPFNAAGVLTGFGAFTPTDTVTFTCKNGDSMTATVMGGSVCELKWILVSGAIVPVGSAGTVVGTINQGVTPFSLNGDGVDEKLAGLTGSGLINAVFAINDIFLRLSEDDGDDDD